MERLRRCPDGFEITVHGGPGRDRVADALLADRARAVAVALDMLGRYLAPRFAREAFHPEFAEVHPDSLPERGDVTLGLTVTPDDDPHAEGYTRFDVHLRLDDGPRWHAVRFTVGYW